MMKRTFFCLIPCLLWGVTSEPTNALAQSSLTTPAAETSATVPVNSTSLSLEQALKTVLERNPNLTRARLLTLAYQIDAARARLDRFTARVDVSLGDTASVGYQLGAAEGANDDPFSNALEYGIGASASVPLFTGGADAANIALSDAVTRSSEVDEALLQRDLIRAAYQAYASIQSYELRLAAARESLQKSTEALTIIKAKAGAGLSAPIEVNRSQVTVVSQEQSLLELENNAYAARQDLLQLLQLEGERVSLGDDLTARPRLKVPEQPDRLIQTAYDQRLELKTLTISKEQLELQRKIAQADYLPRVSAEFSAQAGAQPSWINETTFENAQREPGILLSSGLSVQWNLFNLGKTGDAVRKLELSLKQIEAQEQLQRSELAQAVKKAHQLVLSLQRREAGVNQQLELSRDNLNIIQTLYGQGSATLLDLFEAQDSYRSALNQAATFRVQLALAELELRWQLGDDLLSTASTR
ncbi:MAG: TolC family protein [Myxococcota bacterium]